jgi:DNA repair exonuclease SbcCD nuclease subunit
MRFAFIHTADWQIGKRFGAFEAEKAAVLREQRLRAVDRVAQAARAAGANTVLVAGDVFDSETVSDVLAGQLLSRLKSYTDLVWHLLPGNHDPARAGGVWEAVAAGGMPANVRVHLTPEPAELATDVVLLPAPLTSKSTAHDPTAWMDNVPSPAGALRIGLAHGSVQGFGSDGDANVPIDPARVKTAGLAYLALGDWHGVKQISDRVWYSGTPEPDSFPDNEPGYALCVRVDDANSAPEVERVATAYFTWMRRQQSLSGGEGLEAIEQEVSKLGADASRHLMALSLEGSISLAEFARVEERLTKLAPQLFHLAPDLARLQTSAAVSDIDELGSGMLATVAAHLKEMAAAQSDNSEVAARALRKLFAIARRIEAGGAR